MAATSIIIVMSTATPPSITTPIAPNLQHHHPGPATPSSATAATASAQPPLAVVSQWPPYAGYPLHLFTSSVEDEFRCIHCRQVLRAPLELSCDHLICRSCYAEATPASSTATATASAAVFKCPTCHAVITEQPHLNKPVQSLIQKLIITCPYKQYGCQHTGAIGKDESVIQQHIQQCPYAPIVCEGCGMEVLRGRKQQHDEHECKARKWQCEFCGEWVAKDEDESAKHRLNTFDRSLLCCHLRPCPNSCSLPTPPSSSASSTLSSSRPHKRQREEEPVSESKEVEPTHAPSTAGLRSALPFWQTAAHIPVCPLGPVTCAMCSVEVQRRDIASHFASFHPLKAVRIETEGRKVEEEKASSVREDERLREQAEKAEKRMQEAGAQLERKQHEWEAERNAQRDSIQQLHAARQADQRALAALQSHLDNTKQEAEQLRQRLQHLQQQQQQVQQQQVQQQQSAGHSPSHASQPQRQPLPNSQPQPQPQQQMNLDAFNSPFSPYYDPLASTRGLPPYTLPADSSPSSFAIRLSTFQTTLNGLLCTHCLQPRFQLTQPGSVQPCGSHHPSGRMLTADGKYSCCGRVKGSVGCQPRAMHVFDFEALQREYPEFRNKCHNVRASTTGVSSGGGRAEVNAMQL